MKVDICIQPDCGDISVTITAPALTDQVKALAARLEGGGALIGWRGDTAVPLAAEEILRCYGEEKGVKVQTTRGCSTCGSGSMSWRPGWTATPLCASPTRRSSTWGRSPPWT